MEFEHKLAISIDVAVALSILGGVVTFIISKITEIRNANFHKSWDKFYSYTNLILPEMLRKRDQYLVLFLDFQSSNAKYQASANKKEGEKPDINILIDGAYRMSTYIKYSFSETLNAFEAFGRSNSKVIERKDQIIFACSKFEDSIDEWRNDVLDFTINKNLLVLKKYESKYKGKDFLAYPALELSQLYGLVASNASQRFET